MNDWWTDFRGDLGDVGVRAELPQRWDHVPGRQNYRFSVRWFLRHLYTFNQYIAPWIKARALPMNVLEVGCYEGMSTVWWLEHLPKDAQLTCVDFWVGGDGPPARDAFNYNLATAQQKLDPCGTVVCAESSTTFWTTTKDCFDLMYIDGDHSVEGVYQDIIAAVPRLLPGGMLLCDDYFIAEGSPADEQATSAQVRAGIDKAFTELGMKVLRLGEAVCWLKPLPAAFPGECL